MAQQLHCTIEMQAFSISLSISPSISLSLPLSPSLPLPLSLSLWSEITLESVESVEKVVGGVALFIRF